jgi:predicted TPR repeat methyltransferase
VLERLAYQAPAVVAGAVGAAVGDPHGDLDVLDAGCGTGLGGPWLRPYARRLVGMDLSEKMIRIAAERGVYDEFVVAELVRHLRRHQSEYDLVTAIDTLCYLGDLGDVAAGLAAALRPGGRAVFTVERAEAHDAPRGFRLNANGRYSHSDAYLRQVLASAGLSLTLLRTTELRLEAGKPVLGCVVVTGRARA